MQLLLSMGMPIKNFKAGKYGNRYNGAILQIIDWDSQCVVKEIEYVQPDPGRWPSVSHLFKGATIFGDECWVVTNNEVVVYDRTTWIVKRFITHPTFNDLHGVLPYKGGYYICNTGLEIVQQFDENDILLDFFNTAQTPTEERFDLTADYRNVASTKPHEVHPNHLFFRGDDLWVNRCHMLDSAMVRDPAVSTEKLPAIGHDGLVVGANTFFSTVNGHLCAISNDSNKIVLDIDLNEANDFGLTVGWTRGLCVRDGRAFVGNTALRNSKSVEFARWVKKKAGGRLRMGSAIIEVDLKQQKIVGLYEMTDRPGAAIYSILAL